MYEHAYGYMDVGVNNIRSRGRAYDYAGAGVNNICSYGHKNTSNISIEGVNN